MDGNSQMEVNLAMRMMFVFSYCCNLNAVKYLLDPINLRLICCVISVICIFSCVLKQQNINKKPPISRDIIVVCRARWFHQALMRLFLSDFLFEILIHVTFQR